MQVLVNENMTQLEKAIVGIKQLDVGVGVADLTEPRQLIERFFTENKGTFREL